MNTQEQEGLRIEATREFSKRDGYWLLPQGKNRFLFYRVVLEQNVQDCTCEEFKRLKPKWCRHLYALKHLLSKQKSISTTVQIPVQKSVARVVPKPPAKKTYTRDWSKYNEACGEEHAEFKTVLYQLCQKLPDRLSTRKGGRPAVPLSDLVYASVTKVRHHKSGRKMKSLLEEEREANRISQIPQASTILNFFNAAESSDILDRLIGECCIPFRTLETEFGIDSTFFQIPRKLRWYDEKTGRSREKLLTFKAHISSGIKTHIIAAIRVTPDRGEDKATADSKQFPFLLQDTSQRFRVLEVLADAAYCGKANFKYVTQIGATLTTRFTSRDKGLAGGDYTNGFLFQRDRPKEHFDKYGLRNNVETTHSMMKREYPGKLLFKSDQSLQNEVLCIALIHNIDCVIAGKYVLGLDIEFWNKD